MIELYGNTSPNVHKVEIFLAEAGLDFEMRLVNTHKGEQFTDWFTKLNINRKIPVIVDRGTDGVPLVLTESGAILIYLAEKTGRFLPAGGAARATALQWLMFQMSAVGPTLGQFNHFIRFAATDTYALGRFTTEARRIYEVLDRRLGESEYLGGDEYGIADMAVFPWIRVEARMFGEQHPVMRTNWEGHPNLSRWFSAIADRPAVIQALKEIDARRSTLQDASEKELQRYHETGAFRRSLQA